MSMDDVFYPVEQIEQEALLELIAPHARMDAHKRIKWTPRAILLPCEDKVVIYLAIRQLSHLQGKIKRQEATMERIINDLSLPRHLVRKSLVDLLRKGKVRRADGDTLDSSLFTITARALNLSQMED